MKNFTRIIALALFLAFTYAADANSQGCRDLDSIIARPDTSFSIGFARTFNITKKQPLVVIYTFYGKNDYYFAVAGKDYLGNLQFKLIETSSGKLLFDSSTEQYCTRKIITFDNTMNLSIQVLTPYWNFKDGVECIRLLVGSRYSIVNNFDFFKEPGE